MTTIDEETVLRHAYLAACRRLAAHQRLGEDRALDEVSIFCGDIVRALSPLTPSEERRVQICLQRLGKSGNLKKLTRTADGRLHWGFANWGSYRP